MLQPWTVILLILVYMALLFGVASWTERRGRIRGRNPANHPLVYALSLAIYCTSWTFYGSVGRAATSGLSFMAIYLGPTLTISLGWIVLRKLVRIKNKHRFTSIADFISARYNRSRAIAALVTVCAILGTVPYIALQLKAVFSTFDLITAAQGAFAAHSHHVGLPLVVLMIVFTIVFGVRRIDATERHQGMAMAIAVESVIKLVALLAVGIFVTYFLFDGLGDILQQINRTPLAHKMRFTDTGGSYITWMTYMVLSMAAILFLPRQFHIAVLENGDEKHIASALWLFPLYLFLINLFVVPIAMGGLLRGLPAELADTFVLRLPLASQHHVLALLVFIGGFSAATSMIMISSMTMATMVTNHLLLPLVEGARGLSFLKRYILQSRWAAVVLFLILGYGFERIIESSYMLVAIGIISFVAALQFAPAILLGIFWRGANRIGAAMGLVAGFGTWFYTLFMPALIKTGWLSHTWLTQGPAGLGFLRPEQLFGLTGLDPVSHSVFWSMLFNIGLLTCGSIMFRQTEDEKALADSFVGALSARSSFSGLANADATIDLIAKVALITMLLEPYFAVREAGRLIDRCIAAAGLQGQDCVSIGQLNELLNEVERELCGSFGTSMAHKILSRSKVYSEGEAEGLKAYYTDILAKLSLTPEELKKRVDYYQQREKLFARHARELQAQIVQRDQEIYERQRMEQILRESEERQKLLLASSPDPIVTYDIEGNVTYVNPAFEQTFGWSLQELLGQAVDHVPPHCREQTRAAIAQLFDTGKVTGFETQRLTKDHRLMDVEISAALFRGNDDLPVGSIIFFRDISERKQAQVALQNAHAELETKVAERTLELARAKEMAEAASCAKSEFLANMSHEIRTPMNGVIGMIRLLLETDLEDEQFEFAQMAQHSAEMLLTVINDILDFSKIEAGKLEFEIIDFDLQATLDDVVIMLGHRAHEKGLELTCRTEPNVPALLRGDPGRLRQVLMNLVNNALKFTDAGKVSVNVALSQDQEDAVRLCFEVRDTGIGIPEDRMNRMFKSFSQADSSTTRRFGGTGLGLAISKKLVEMMEGSIGVRSQVGRGSCFWFTTVFQHQKPVASQVSDQPKDFPDKKILLVMAESTSRRTLSTCLQNWHCRYELLDEADKALPVLEQAAAGHEPFDLTIIDHTPFKIDALRLGAAIQARPGLKGISMVMLASFGLRGDAAQSQDIGFRAYLKKPLAPSVLLDCLMTLFHEDSAEHAASRGTRQNLITRHSIKEARRRKLRVLLAEDNLINQKLALKMLEKLGHTAQTATNGKEAVALLKTQTFDLVLMDIQMPEMDGFQATQLIREQRDGRLNANVPIIAMTANAMKGDREKCLDAGMNDYLSKPVNPRELVEKLEKWSA